MWFNSDKGEPLLLKGALINSPESYADAVVLCHVQQGIGALLQRRADQNSTELSKGTWNEPAPIWNNFGTATQVSLPTHHPDFDPPTETTDGLQFTSLTARLSAAIRSMRNIITRKVAGLMVCRGIVSLQPNLFRTIRHQLESIENEHPGIRPAENDEPDDRALRLIAQGLGEGGRNGYRRADCGDDGGSGRDQGVDGALYEGDGDSGAGNKRDDFTERGAAGDKSTTLGTGRGHQMAPSATEPVRLSRVAFLRYLRSASDCAFPHDEVSIEMTVDGCFKISMPRGAILISEGGKVVGMHGITESDLIEFVNELPAQAVRHLSLPGDMETPELF